MNGTLFLPSWAQQGQILCALLWKTLPIILLVSSKTCFVVREMSRNL